jgi:hypothetical protein
MSEQDDRLAIEDVGMVMFPPAPAVTVSPTDTERTMDDVDRPPNSKQSLMSGVRELEDAWAEYADWRSDCAAGIAEGSFSLSRLEDARLHLQSLINVPRENPNVR